MYIFEVCDVIKFCDVDARTSDLNLTFNSFTPFRATVDTRLFVLNQRIKRLMHDETHSLSLKGALNILRLSHHDTDVFYKFKGVCKSKRKYLSFFLNIFEIQFRPSIYLNLLYLQLLTTTVLPPLGNY